MHRDPPDMRSWPRRAQVAILGVRREDLLMDAAAGLLLWKVGLYILLNVPLL